MSIKTKNPIINLLLLAGLLCAFAGSASAFEARCKDFDLGFIASRDTALDGAKRVRGLGPIYEKQVAPDGKSFLAVRPFYCRVKDPSRQRILDEYVWPLAMNKWNQQEQFARLALFFYHDFHTEDPGLRRRFILFPIWFSGTTVKGGRYYALFPVGGRIGEFLGMDTINFVLFPLYVNYKVGDVKTHDILWPIISWSSGRDVKRFRVFPFYGRSVNKGRWTKQFILWPILTQVRYDYPQEQGSGFILFPVCGRIKTSKQSVWMLVPPLFKYARSEKQLVINSPYPFIQYASGGYDKLYVWPLFGRKHVAGEHSYFALWPIGHYASSERDRHAVKRLTVIPLFFYDRRIPLKDAVAADAADKKYLDRTFLKLWPLFSYARESESSRIRVVDLWPGRNYPAMDRNLSPFWTIYSRVREGESSENEFLWGLVRSADKADGSGGFSLFPLVSWQSGKDGDEQFKWDFLKGLIGYKNDGLQKKLRLLYFIELGGKRKDTR